MPTLGRLAPEELIRWDHRATAMSPRGHPLQAIRQELTRQGFPDARTLGKMPSGSKVSYVGAVICRQRPGTAKGVLFMTMEDETGFVNVIVWPKVYEQYATVVKTQALLGIHGRLQTEEGVSHLIADAVWGPHLQQAPSAVPSRDFQ